MSKGVLTLLLGIVVAAGCGDGSPRDGAGSRVDAGLPASLPDGAVSTARQCGGEGVPQGDMGDLDSCQRQGGDWQVQRGFCSSGQVECRSRQRRFCLNRLGCRWTEEDGTVIDTLDGACFGFAPDCGQVIGEADCTDDYRCTWNAPDAECRRRGNTQGIQYRDCLGIDEAFQARTMHHFTARERCLWTYGCAWQSSEGTVQARDGRLPAMHPRRGLTFFPVGTAGVRVTLTADSANPTGCPAPPSLVTSDFFSDGTSRDDCGGTCSSFTTNEWLYYASLDPAALEGLQDLVTASPDECSDLLSGNGATCADEPLDTRVDGADFRTTLYQNSTLRCGSLCAERGGWVPSSGPGTGDERWYFTDRLVVGDRTCLYRGIAEAAP